MPGEIRLGIIGASPTVGWAHRSHLPAIVATPEFELTGVCTTRRETVDESARQYGARLAFDDHRDMLAHPDIDAVTVSVRVPYHYQITKDALNAGKHVFTEWPLGADINEAQELAGLARSKCVTNIVGLQARGAPAILHMKELVAEGYVGDIMSCSMRLIRGGVLERPLRPHLAAGTMLWVPPPSPSPPDTPSTPCASLREVSARSHQWFPPRYRNGWRPKPKKWWTSLLQITSCSAGRLANGAVVSVHVASIPWAGSGYIMEIYGRGGTLVATSEDSPQLWPVRVQGAQKGDNLVDLDIPAHHIYVPQEFPRGEAYNVGQLYQLFGRAIRGEKNGHPDFDTAVSLHRFIDAVRQASDEGKEVPVPA